MKLIKKHIKLIILIVVIISIFIIYKITNNNNINYTSLGDGFSIGKNCYGQINYGYSDYIKDYLEQNNKLNNYEKGFSSTDMSIDKLYADIITNKTITKDSKKINIKRTLRETSILTISIGMNDLIYKLSIEENLNDKKVDNIILEIEKSFDHLINEIKKYYPHKIYLIGYYNIENNNIYLKKGISKLNEMYAENENIIYIDIEELFEKNKKFLANPDSIYPNDEGYQVISDKIITKMTKKLEKT